MEPVLFAAIFPPPDVLAAIASVQDEVRARLPGRITWVAPERMHVTVFYFGAERADGTAEVERWVGWALDTVRAGAFELELSGLGIVRQRIGDGHRSILLDGGGCKPLCDLASRVNRDANRPPHLTLGRTRQRLALPALAAPRIAFRAERIVLVRSVRDGGERSYHRLREWELPGGATLWRGWGA